jgi:hypothetical protein
MGKFSNEIVFAATAPEDYMGDTFQGTQPAQANHPALIGNVPGLNPKIRTANITGN